MSLLGRLPRTPLVTRLLAAVTAVLALSLVVTYVVESNLTRSALRSQAELVLEQRAHAAENALAADVQAVIAELQVVNSSFRRTDLGASSSEDAVTLTDLLEGIASRQGLSVVSVFSREGDHTEFDLRGPGLEPPPDAAYDTRTASLPGRVVDTLDGRSAFVAGEVLRTDDGDILVLLGYVLDASYARDVRNAAGDQIVLKAGDELVTWSLPAPVPDQLDPLGFRDATEVHEVDGTTYWARFAAFEAPEDGWGRPIQLGVFIEEPLARLDAALVRNRLGAGAALLVIATVLAWIVSRRMTRPLRELTATAARITAGDRDAEFPVTTDDEVGVLARALEDMRQGLGHQLELIQRQAEALRDAGGRLVNAQDEARRRMAGDLHDGVQRQLVMLRLHIGFGRERIRRDPAAAEEVLDELSAEIDAVLGRLRETAQGIYPSILRDRGLEGALFSLGARSRLPVELEVEPEPLPRLSHEVEANTYFLASEAVTNAVKHADASRVVVTVRVQQDALLLTVQDDGQGFDPDDDAAGRGLGNMRDRAGALGGHVEIASGPGGTVVTARMPLSGSVAGPLEEEQHGRDTAVQLDVLAKAELLEDRVDVLLDRAFRDAQVPGDAPVPLARRHDREDVELPGREPGEP